MNYLVFSILLLLSVNVLSQNEIDFTEEEKVWISEHPIVYYGFDPAWKPIEFSEDGEHVGISRDYINILSERTGIDFQQHPEADSWTKSLDLFKSDEALLITAIGENEERKKFMQFTEAYQTYAWVIVTLKDGDFVGSIEDLEGKTVASPEGYFITNLLENEDVNLKYTSGVEESLMEITTGEADATISNLAVISHYLNYNGFENIKIAAPAMYPDLETKMGVSINEPILRSIIDKGLATITHKEKHEIVQNWVSVQFEHGINMTKIWTIAGVSLLIVGSIFGFFVFWNRKLKKEVSMRKEAEFQLQGSFDEISMQKILIEEKNEEVLDSIKYAKRIQEAILPPLELIDQCIPKNFVLYIPKDIVAGDFYWMEKIKGEQGNDIVFIAAADCTGHGVPGAMVSVVCSNALNRSLLEYGLTNPGQLLDKTTDLVIERFSRAEDEVKDGMDISVCSIEKNNEGALIEFAGAHNHLWVITKREEIGVETTVTKFDEFDFFLHEIRANKQPVGKFFKREPFKTTRVNLLKDERFYLYSDGYADQFGGEHGKKLKNKTFKKMILETMEVSLNEQKRSLHDDFMDWKSDFEQLDDICIIGIEV